MCQPIIRKYGLTINLDAQIPSCKECKDDPEGAEAKCRQAIAVLLAKYLAEAAAPGLLRGALDAGVGLLGAWLATHAKLLPGGILMGYAVVDTGCTFKAIHKINDAAKKAAETCSCSKYTKKN